MPEEIVDPEIIKLYKDKKREKFEPAVQIVDDPDDDIIDEAPEEKYSENEE